MELQVWKRALRLADLAWGEVVTDDCDAKFGEVIDDVARSAPKVCDGGLVANDVLPAKMITRNQWRAETVLQPWTPVFAQRLAGRPTLRRR